MARRILAVDDDDGIRRMVQVHLKRAGYTVITARDGQEAVEKARAEQPDAIVMDVMMPRMTGFEALDVLKADPQTAGIPVILLTAESRDEDLFTGWSRGVHAYLTKPFRPEELIAGVQGVLE